MAIEKVVYESVPKSEKDERNGGPPQIASPKAFGVRHLQSILLFLSLSIAYSMRAHLSVTMVSMTDTDLPRHSTVQCYPIVAEKYNGSDSIRLNTIPNTVPRDPETDGGLKVNVTKSFTNGNNNLNVNETLKEDMMTDTEVVCKEVFSNLSMWNVYRSYEWKKSTQEIILFSFFVGYTSMMMPMGLVAQKFGGKLPIMIALGVNAVISVVTPWLPIWFGWQALCICRLLQGMTQAACYPSIHTLLARWSPLSERGRLSSYIYTGSQFGTILAFQLAGVFAGSTTFRWPATFWFSGLASLVCFFLLGWQGAASPHQHPSISAEELAFITKDGSVDRIPKKRKTPWKHIITSPPMWGLIVAQSGSNISYLLILTQMPMYMKKILGLDIKSNGLYSSLPYIAMYFTVLLFGALSDFAANRKLMSVANIRRTANTIGLVVSGLLLVVFGYIRNTLLAVITLIATMAMHSGVHFGFHINQIDLAPNFAGPMMALGNMIGNLSGLIVPVLVSNIVGDHVEDQSKWRTMFFIVTAIAIIANTVFVIFVKGEVQPWNFYGEEDINEEFEVSAVNGKKGTIIVKEDESKL